MPAKTAKKKSKATSAESATAAASEMVEVLRTCDKNLRSHGGFQWPESGPVTAPDWNPKPICGGGLHGLLEGQGDWNLLDWSIDARAMIVETDKATIVELNGKVKFKTGIVKRLVSLTEGLCYFVTGSRITEQVKEIKAEAEKDNDPAAASGDYSQLAASGDYSQLAASGDSSQLAASGYSSKLAASGDSSKLAASGDYSKLAASGDSSQLAASGYSSQLAASGKNSVVMAAGEGSIAKAGEDGAIAISYKDSNGRFRIVVGYVGENGIEADTWYRAEGGALVKA